MISIPPLEGTGEKKAAWTVSGHRAKNPTCQIRNLEQYFSNLWVHLVSLVVFFQHQFGKKKHYSLEI